MKVIAEFLGRIAEAIRSGVRAIGESMQQPVPVPVRVRPGDRRRR
jgi:hypothetical protein